MGTEQQVLPTWVLTRTCARPSGIPPRGGEPELPGRAAPGRRDVQGRLLLSQLRRGPKGPQLPQRPAPVRAGASGQGRGRRGPPRASSGMGEAVGVGWGGTRDKGRPRLATLPSSSRVLRRNWEGKIPGERRGPEEERRGARVRHFSAS